MTRKSKVIYVVLVLVLLASCYFYVAGNRISTQVPSSTATENLPDVENKILDKGKNEESTTMEKQPSTPQTSSGSDKIERSPAVPPSSGEEINLQEQSYSIHNTKKEITITPGVTFQPGKSVNLKVGEEVIRVQRDKTYHPGGYNVLWEKKY